MQSLFAKSQHYLSYLDYFSLEFHWRYKRSDRIKSAFGGLLALALLVFLIYKINLLVTKIREGDLATIKQINKLTNEKIFLHDFTFSVCPYNENFYEEFIETEKIFEIDFEVKKNFASFSNFNNAGNSNKNNSNSSNSINKNYNHNLIRAVCNPKDFDALLFETMPNPCVCFKFSNSSFIQETPKKDQMLTLYSEDIFVLRISEKEENLYKHSSINLALSIKNNIFNYTNYEISNYYSYFELNPEKDFLAKNNIGFSRINMEKYYEIDNDEYLLKQQDTHKILALSDNLFSNDFNSHNYKGKITQELSFFIDYRENITYKITWFTLDNILAILGGMFQIIFLIVGFIGRIFNEFYLQNDFIQLLKGKQREFQLSFAKLNSLFAIQKKNKIKRSVSMKIPKKRVELGLDNELSQRTSKDEKLNCASEESKNFRKSENLKLVFNENTKENEVNLGIGQAKNRQIVNVDLRLNELNMNDNSNSDRSLSYLNEKENGYNNSEIGINADVGKKEIQECKKIRKASSMKYIISSDKNGFDFRGETDRTQNNIELGIINRKSNSHLEEYNNLRVKKELEVEAIEKLKNKSFLKRIFSASEVTISMEPAAHSKNLVNLANQKNALNGAADKCFKRRVSESFFNIKPENFDSKKIKDKFFKEIICIEAYIKLFSDMEILKMLLLSNTNNKIFNEISNYHLINQHFTEEKLAKLKDRLENSDIAELNKANHTAEYSINPNYDSCNHNKIIEESFQFDDLISKRLHEYFEYFE